ncbi:MAG: DUF1800 domain-containing protein [Alphaproteobacteria bacterium]|nr:DUF1800 domain-containing protein [Alphaproteobacteria bacterium]
MLQTTPSFETLALNRVTFGARERDAARVRQMGWAAWVDEQLKPPPGDDPDLAAHLATQRMRIRYVGQPPTKNITGWPDLDQFRPLTYLRSSVAELWTLVRNVEDSVAANELTRIQEEVAAANWIRNTHSAFQLREFMADFWNNHFNVGRQADQFGAAALPDYDANVIRPRVFGNFRDLLGAVARSAAMLRYLNNADSTAARPNENYARELLELHTLGGGAYRGVGTPRRAAAAGAIFANGDGFTDGDILSAARALSGWTLAQGQQGPGGRLSFTGAFVYNPLQHNAEATTFLGTDLASLTGPMQQGEVVLDLIANHPLTAAFVVGKLARRMFGDKPPAAVIERGVSAWFANVGKSDQLARVLRTMLIDGPEIGATYETASKVRRPYERIIAFLRATDTVVSAFGLAVTAAAALGDGLYAWPTPEGRPDDDASWLSTSANLYNWNLLLLILDLPQIRTTLAAQTPPEVTGSATGIVEYWVGRLLGYAARPAAMSALIADAAQPFGVVAAYRSGGIANIERALRRQVALIASSPEFGRR